VGGGGAPPPPPLHLHPLPLERFGVAGGLVVESGPLLRREPHRSHRVDSLLAAAGGFTFDVSREAEIRAALIDFATETRNKAPAMWESRLGFDCQIPAGLLSLEIADLLDEMKPFGHGFEEPRFVIEAPVVEVRYFYDKATGNPKHTAVFVEKARGKSDGKSREKILFFNEVIQTLKPGMTSRFVVSCSRNTWRGTTSLSLMGHDHDGSGTEF